MPRIMIQDFKGELPRRVSYLNDKNQMALAIDADLRHGDIRPFPCPVPICNVGSEIKSIYELAPCGCNGTSYLTFDRITDIVRDISCDLHFWTDSDGPKISTGTELCAGTGMPWNIQCPTVTPTGGGSIGTECDFNPTFYRYSFIIEKGGREMESHWSPPLGPVGRGTVSVPSAPNVTKVRIYRAATGFHSGEEDQTESNADWFVVGDTIPGGSLVDTLTDDQLIRKSPISPEYFAPPPAGLHSLARTDSGAFVGLSGRYLHWSLPGLPMAWRDRKKFIRPEHGRPLRIVVDNDHVYVLTDNKPILFVESKSDSGNSFERYVYPKPLPLISVGAESLGAMGVVYPTTHGLATLKDQSMAVISSTHMEHDDWRRTDPSSMAGTVYEDSYFMSTSVDGYTLDYRDGIYSDSPNSRLIGLDMDGLLRGISLYHVSMDNRLLFAKGGILYEWDIYGVNKVQAHDEDILDPLCESCCPYRVRIPLTDTEYPVPWNAGEIDMDRTTGDSVNFKFVQVDCGIEENVEDMDISDCGFFRIDTCRRFSTSYVELAGCRTIRRLTLATSVAELRPGT